MKLPLDQIIANFGKDISEKSSKLNKAKSIMSIDFPVIQRYTISYLYNGVGSVYSFDCTNEYEYDSLIKFLPKLGIPELANASHVEFSDGVLSFLIENMEKDTIVIYGDRIRYSVPGASVPGANKRSALKWEFLSNDVKVIVTKLPQTKEDVAIAVNKKNEEIFKQLKENDLIDGDGLLIL